MNGMRVFLVMGLVLAGAANAWAQTTLHVNASSGSDSVPKGSNSASTPWRTIGRAVWGSTNRSAMNPSEAAAAGDTVLVAGGTYTTSVAVNDRWAVVYNPVNAGTASQPITITCVGACVLGAQNANGPVIGASERSYIKWYADIAQGHFWQLNSYGRQGGTAGPTQINTTPDTGPVVCHATSGCWIEGMNIDGGLQLDYSDNYNGVRLESCTSCTVRNNIIRNFRNLANSGNGTGVTLYGSANAIVEHNLVANVGSGIAVKDTGASLPQQAVVVRFNRFDNADRCISTSMTTSTGGRNYVYQNVCMNGRMGLHVTGNGFRGEWYFNNTFYNLSEAGVLLQTTSGSGGRFWNNVVINSARAVVATATMPPDSVVDFEHNVYNGLANHYTGPEGDRSLSSFRSAYPTHEQAAPASVSTNPMLVNPGAGDFRMCTGAGAPVSSCSGPSPVGGLGVDLFDLDGDGNTTEVVRPGAYVTNGEIMGPTALPNGLPRAPLNLRVIGQ